MQYTPTHEKGPEMNALQISTEVLKLACEKLAVAGVSGM
jgi:hypothetical protein